MAPLFACCALIGAVACAPAFASTPPASTQLLSDLLQRQTEAFARASQSGDRAVLARYLDPDVVFTNETGQSAIREELLDGASASTGPLPQSVIVDWVLRLQGDVATATFTDVVTRDLFGHVVETRLRSTETWPGGPTAGR